ncbi:hypothetical protein [Natrinema sp. SYSU A 869]|uniref:DUF7857 domain-containing protein n=1 Tax=Natrinema sp. SYSU A 869 TaxID=2871694 RepID=UPI001CA3F1A0|nr:hypothetical protein [Natrinema sp. SYSU A 869]
MIELDWETDRTEGVTLISATVANALTTPQLVRIESRIDGPLWSPDREQHPAPEWTDGRWEGVVKPTQCRGVGFASPSVPSDPADPPLEVTETRRVSSDQSAATTDVLASLPNWRPTLNILGRQR